MQNLQNSDQIKQAPAGENNSRRIFKNFRDATVALMECDDKPAGVDQAVCVMLDRFNNELGGADGEFEDDAESDSANAYRVMSKVFGLSRDDDGPAPAPTTIDACLETPKAAPELRPQAGRRIETKYQFGCFGARGAFSDEAIRDLVSRIIPRDDDDAVKAFVTLIDSIAYNDDNLIRDHVASHACDAAYQRSMAYHDVAGKFFDGATAEARLRAKFGNTDD